MSNLLRRVVRPFARPAIERYAQLRAHLDLIDAHIADLHGELSVMREQVAAMTAQQMDLTTRVRTGLSTFGALTQDVRRAIEISDAPRATGTGHDPSALRG